MRITSSHYGSILAIGLILACVGVILFDHFHQYQEYQDQSLTFTAFWLTLAALYFLIPTPNKRLLSDSHKGLSGVGKLWCVLIGPSILLMSIAFWWMLHKLSPVIGARTLNLLQIPAMLVVLWMTIRTAARSYGYLQPELDALHDRRQCILRAEAFAGFQQYQRAIDEYTIGIDRNPTDGELYYLRAATYDKLGENGRASTDRETATKLGYKPGLKES